MIVIAWIESLGAPTGSPSVLQLFSIWKKSRRFITALLVAQCGTPTCHDLATPEHSAATLGIAGILKFDIFR
jgi:hypothetical protein